MGSRICMKNINLALGIHNHQPIGNFDSVFEHAYEHAYRPFIDLLEQFPHVKVAQHYTGILLEWLVQHRPDLLKRIAALVKRGQVEIMGGAYYEAILSIIPDNDKHGQLMKLTRATKKHFGARPTGMWLAERVWEQHLARFIADADLHYIVIDDTHFKYAGFAEEELLGHYVTEEQGRKISIFPISKMLRYTIPFQPVEKTIDYLRSVATEDGKNLVVFADDGEKFGVWPNTYKHVYLDGWLREFFQALTDNREWIHLVHFKDAIKTFAPLGRTYLPNASYAEMMHWALPAHHFTLYEEFEHLLKNQGLLEKYESFFKGGFWRNFLAKYPETNQMHKKMMRVSMRARKVQEKHKGKRIAKTFEKIWAAQCNDPYWHGVFGGLYLPNLRYPIYKNLIAAETELDRMENLKRIRTEATDFDCDGKEEIIVESPLLNCYFKPDLGGAIYELDFKSISFNLIDIVSRREEGYHGKLKHAVSPSSQQVISIHDVVLMKEEGLQTHVNYDWYRHGTLIDHFFGDQTTLDDLWKCKYREIGDFVNQPYHVRVKKKQKQTIVELSRDGGLWESDSCHRIRVQKSITFDQSTSDLDIEYRLTNLEQQSREVWFGVEFNVGLQAGDAPDRYYFSQNSRIDDPRLRSRGELPNLSMLGLKDEWLGLEVRIVTESPTTFWRFPIETVSLSEAGFERVFQSSVVVPHWRFTLEKAWTVRLKQTMRKIK
ncbi:MAG TPA: alpha-amylase/4-alpha-glucanotransferase domain-containing protein [Bacteroidota bacterium]|nr:alpha-amylase/4-alpha-glucanotransferase domain-containing protein [Bacteroidota bacterium]